MRDDNFRLQAVLSVLEGKPTTYGLTLPFGSQMPEGVTHYALTLTPGTIGSALPRREAYSLRGLQCGATR